MGHKVGDENMIRKREVIIRGLTHPELMLTHPELMLAYQTMGLKMTTLKEAYDKYKSELKDKKYGQ